MHRFVCTDVNSLKFGFVNYALYIPYSLNRYVQHDASGETQGTWWKWDVPAGWICPAPSPWPLQTEVNETGRGGGAVCVTYFYSLPCLSNYVCYANPVRDCVSVCVCVSLNLLCKDQRGNDLHELLYGTVLQKVSMHICELISAIYETRCIYSFIY